MLAATVLALFFSAYSVTGITRTASNLYKAEVNIVRGGKGEPAVLPKNARQFVIVETQGCTHVPSAGADAIVFHNYKGDGILFSDGPVCKVVAVTTETTL